MRLNDDTAKELMESVGIEDYDPAGVDLCYPCYLKMRINDDVEHPDYDTTDPVYHCALCGEPLTSADN